jgi:hypothetical protein
MADVIRRAIIEIETRQKKSRLQAPTADSTTAGFKAQAEMAGKAEQATSKAEQSQRKLAETSRSTAYTMATSFRESGEGALRVARGLALLSASGSDDLKKLVHHVALAQGALDIFAGSLKVATNLGIPFRLASLGVGALTTALGVGAHAWKAWGEAAEQSSKRAEDATKKIKKELKQLEEERRSRDEYGDLVIRLSQGKDKQVAIEAEVARAQREQRELGIESQRFVAGEFVPQVQTIAGPQLTMTGRPERVPGEHLGVAEEHRKTVRREIDLQEQLRDLKEQELREQQRLAKEVMSGGISGLRALGFQGAAAGLKSSAFTQHFGETDGLLKELNTTFKTTVGGLLQTLRQTDAEVRDLRNKQDGANPR